MGCQTTIQPDQEWRPFAVEVKSPDAFQAYLNLCWSYAIEWAKGVKLDVGDIGLSAAKGGVENAPGAAVNVFVPVLGALGAGSSKALSELNLGDGQKRVVTKCMTEEGRRTGQFIILEPDQ